MFVATHPFAFFDYFRIPYEVRPRPQGAGALAGAPTFVHGVSAAGQAGRRACSLLWLGMDASLASTLRTFPLGRYQLRDFTFFGHVAPEATVPAILQDPGRGWHAADPISDAQGHRVASIWRHRDGSIFLPFDPGEVMNQFWSEQYLTVGHSAAAAAGRAALTQGYYLLRPALPRRLQLRLRRAFTRVQARTSFPAWPIEDSLHDLYRWLFTSVTEVAGRPVPFLSLWPGGRSWAMVLTHDVETGAGYRDMGLLRNLEREGGYRSSWNFVALRYPVDDDTVRALHDEGCEVGVHGLRHDGRDLGSRRLMEKRLPAIREYAGRWNAAGFRSPSTQRAWELMPRLGFDYDSSYSDTDPYEPQPGGCCSYLPFLNQGMVELPITLPQDHTLFCIVQDSGADTWLRKARHLRARGAMALVLTHPDYAGDPQLAEGYRALLDAFECDDTVWHALPSEVATWWRQRSASTVGWDGHGWSVQGPASASGTVSFTTFDEVQSASR
ncbi:MAG: hypothetical protein ACLQK8_01860 [Streptosporangiaceae bacterium]